MHFQGTITANWVNEGLNYTTTMNISITFLNDPPRINISTFNLYLRENEKTTEPVITIEIKDPDVGQDIDWATTNLTSQGQIFIACRFTVLFCCLFKKGRPLLGTNDGHVLFKLCNLFYKYLVVRDDAQVQHKRLI